MKKIRLSEDLKTSLLFTLIGLVASVFVALYQITMLTEELQQQVIAQVGSINAMIPIAAAQGALLTFALSFIGLKLAKKVNLRLNFVFDKKALTLAILIGAATALIITLSDIFLFAKYLPVSMTTYVFSPIYLISGILYGGVIEEILLRLFVMSLLVLILWKLFAKSKDQLSIPSGVYIAAIFLSALLFAAGHLPITLQSIGHSVPIIVRCFVLNGIGGLGFGYLYWKKGLAYSMCAHATTHVFMQVILMPILF